MGLLNAVDRVLLNQRGHLFPWAPVCLALGIGLWFALKAEPGPAAYAAALAAGLAAGGLAWARPSGLSALGWGAMLVAAGFALAGWRAHRIAAPVLDYRYYGPVEGRVVGIDRSASDALRITLDRVRLEGVAPADMPHRVRLSLHGQGGAGHPVPGARVMTTAYLSPPQGPVEPGGFDFRRHAWFQGLGAVGYTRVPVLLAEPPAGGAGVFGLRMAVSDRVQAALGGDVGGFAAAVTTGDRSGMSGAALDALRASNTAHLLAISGLHMGLLAGFVFAALRIGMSLVPPLALRLPVKKLAAGGALAVAAVYLALSGGNVATERAFIMAAVALCAVIADRRAFSLRAVAALIVLALRPETLLSPGFQMSFAATTALVAVFGFMRDAGLRGGPAWARPAVAVLISSAVAGLATAPVGMAHFNTTAHYGLLANLSSVPVMGLLVIPAAVLAACLAPLGLEEAGLWAMGLGLRWILGVAHWVSALPGAQGFVPAPPGAVLPLLALGSLGVILWQGRARWAGLAPALCALALWAGAERPALLIAEDGGLVGVMGSEGRALSKPRGAGFVARTWLENDGDGADQAGAAARWSGGGDTRRAEIAGREVIHLTGKKAALAWGGCAEGQVIVSPHPLTLRGPCAVFDPPRLRRIGSVALRDGRFVGAREAGGLRLWNGAVARPERGRMAALRDQ